MPRKKPMTALTPLLIDSRIHLIRGVRVMLDSDLAELYEVPTMRLNEQVKRNRERFPEEFAFQLTPQEFTDLISQNATSSSTHGGRRKLPWAFTEYGVAMLSGVLRSETAVRVNIEIIRAFVRLRQLLATPGEFLAQLQKLTESVELHDDQIKKIVEVLRQLMPPLVDPPKRRIGFIDTENHEPEAN